MRIVPLIVAACFVGIAGFVRADPANTPDIALQRDVPYETIDGVSMKFDIALPAATQGDGPFPLILCVHGGAWRVGDKSKFTGMIEELARHGYVAASINYRFAPKYQFPAQLDDTKAALLFLKRHAAQYKIDVQRVGGAGESAGSHLLMMMAFTAAAADPKATADPLTSTRLGAIANYYGPVDLTDCEIAPLVSFMWQRQFHERFEDSMKNFLGSQDKGGPKVKAASPINYVTRDAPPTVTFHGTLDPLVPFHQAEVLAGELKEKGVAERLVPIANGLHGGWAPEARKKADDHAIAWFDKYLKGKPDPIPEWGTITADGKALAASSGDEFFGGGGGGGNTGIAAGANHQQNAKPQPNAKAQN